MKRLTWISAAQFGAALLTACGLAGCDADPAAPARVTLTAATPITGPIARQGQIMVGFSQPITPTSALDPSNFVVTNTCNGLQVPGSLSLNARGDTVTFTPSQALPFLTPLAIRVQNILTANGEALRTPFTFAVTTEAPPVSDVSWDMLNSPTNDDVTGVTFVNRSTGYIVTGGGGVYRTDNTGVTFGARFKSVEISPAYNIRAFGLDTAFMVASFKAGAQSRFTVFRTVNGGFNFDSLTYSVAQFLTSLSMERDATGAPIGATAGTGGGIAAYRFDGRTGQMVQATGLPASVSGVVSYAASSVALSKNATRAVVTGFAQQAPNNSRSGVAYRSINGGLTYSPLVLPARTYVLNGAGFINNDEALILGDSSVILRMDASGNLTALTGAQGVPQATTDTATGTVTTYSFVKADFAPGSNVGFVIGRARRVSPSGPPVVTGVILISRDGGRTFTRQAIRGEPNNGQDFPITIDLQVLTPDFAALSGSNGLVAARTSDVQTGVQACSFTNANNP